jgi:hypothetical protein
MQRRIGENLDLWDAERPDCAPAAALFCLSLKNRGRSRIEAQAFKSVLEFFAGDINERFNTLGVLYRMIWLTNPASYILRRPGRSTVRRIGLARRMMRRLRAQREVLHER